MASKVELRREIERLQDDKAKLYVQVQTARSMHVATLQRLQRAQKHLANWRWPWYRTLWFRFWAWLRESSLTAYQDRGGLPPC